MYAAPKDIKKLAKLLTYVLGRRPDEFGLIPNTRGFVKLKELLKALHEEQGWRHLRRAHLHELLLSVIPAPIEIENNLIRAQDRTHLPVISPVAQLPKLLYTAIRKRAYPVVLANGIRPSHYPQVILSCQASMAERLGRRLDSSPVVLTIQVASSQEAGVHYRQYGQTLFLADAIPTGVFNGPPLPADKIKPTKSVPPEQVAPKTPGSYFPDLAITESQRPPPSSRKRRTEKAWKNERRMARKEKERRWR